MTTSRKTQSALRAALKNEDAALAQRLPDTGKTTKSVTAKPVAAKPAAVKPVAAKPAAVKPVAVKPVAVKPVAVKRVAAKPVAAKPVAAKPVAAKPVAAKPAAAKPAAAKPAPASADVAVAPSVASVTAASLQVRPVSPIKPEKRVRETFSLGRSDIDRLTALKARGKKNGAKYGRSAILRAGLVLLEAQDATTVSALIEQLPAFKKDKRKKK